MTLSSSFASAIIAGERNAFRFEKFCADLYEAAESTTVVTTAATYDLGRDARGISPQDVHVPVVLCVSLRRDVTEKVTFDLTRLKATTQPLALIYCSSRLLTEHHCDRIEQEVRNFFPSVRAVRVLGQHQLVELASAHEAIFIRHYEGELSDLRRTLLDESEQAEGPESMGLRLAIMTQTGNDASALRMALSRRLVLERLSVDGRLTVKSLAQKISAQLHLPRSIAPAYIEEIVDGLLQEGLVAMEDKKARLTDEGRQVLRHVPEDAAAKLLEGRTVVRSAIETLSGYRLQDTDFARLWVTFQDGIAGLFYRQGEAIIKLVSAVKRSERSDNDSDVRAELERLAARIAQPFSQPDQREDIRLSVIDMFLERDSEAFAWLSDTCSVFVMMCSLGLEPIAGKQVAQTLGRIALLLDTDVLLSVLCDGELNHNAAKRVVHGWREIGGAVYVPDSSLEEAAYHAWIANRDFEATAHLLRQRSADGTPSRLITNAFVRAFWSRRLPRKDWPQFNRDYRGSSPNDFTKIAEIVHDEYGVQRYEGVPSRDARQDVVYRQALSYMQTEQARYAGCNANELDRVTMDKLRRDAALLAGINRARRESRTRSMAEIPIALSSAHVLKLADNRFRGELGKPDAVMSLAAAATLLLLVPGVQMGLNTLREVLFDLNLGRRLHPLSRLVYRVLEASEEYRFLGWSKRATLRRRLTERLLSDAKKSGKSFDELEKKVEQGEDPVYVADVIKGALDGMAVPPATKALVEELTREIKRLNAEISHRDTLQEKRHVQ
jgi:hypothetical protein